MGRQSRLKKMRQADPAPTARIAAVRKSDQDLRDIHAYLRSIPRSPSAKNIPLLNP